jgi:tetrahydromethanopterin S-methyltransferase subunit H
MAGTLGADLLMFGPIENCEAAATSMAFTDIVLAETLRELGGDIKEPNHPINKLV